MIIEKALALLRSLQSRFLAKLALLPDQASAPATTLNAPVSSQERGTMFVASSKYAEYVASVAYSDRRYPDAYYSSRS